MSDCKNCGSPLDGPFCGQYGQRDADHTHRSDLAGDAIREAFELDGRMIRTARVLHSPELLDS